MMTTTVAIMTMIESNISISGSMNTLTLAKLLLSARFQVTQSIPWNRSSSDFFQIVIRSSRQSSSWRGTFWSTARQRLFSVMSVIERFAARIIWGITRKFTTLARPSTLALMIPVPAPTTQWPVSENTRLVGSHQSWVTKELAVLLLLLTSQLLRIHSHTHTLVLPKNARFCSVSAQEVFMSSLFVIGKHWTLSPQHSFNPFIRQCTLLKRASLTAKSAKWCFPAR